MKSCERTEIALEMHEEVLMQGLTTAKEILNDIPDKGVIFNELEKVFHLFCEPNLETKQMKIKTLPDLVKYLLFTEDFSEKVNAKLSKTRLLDPECLMNFQELLTTLKGIEIVYELGLSVHERESVASA